MIRRDGKLISTFQSPKTIFICALVFAAIYTIIFYSSSLDGDEGRYIGYAKSLNEGSFASPSSPGLGNGPGYPLLIYPFIALFNNARLSVILNPILFALTTLLVFKSISLFQNRAYSANGAWLFALYWPLWIYIPRILTEVFSTFLIAYFSYLLLYTYKSKSMRAAIGAGLVYAILILTKPIYAHVIYVVSVIVIILLIYNNNKIRIAKQETLMFLVTTIILSHIYLSYTYYITGMFPYWITQNTPLWSMTTLRSDEVGSWLSTEEREEYHPYLEDIMANRTAVEIGQAYDSLAISNIKSNPMKYAKNWVNNVSRYLFNYPYSRTGQKLSTMFYIVPNFIMLIYFVKAFKRMLKNKKELPISIIILLMVLFIYSAGSTLVSASTRRLTIMVPIIYVLITYAHTVSNTDNKKLHQTKREEHEEQ